MRSDLPRILRNGGRVRVLILDPTDESLISTADRQRTHSQGVENLRQRVLTTLQDLTTIRVLSSIPTAGFNCLDMSKTNGLVCVQHYEFHPDGEAAPIRSAGRGPSGG
ncbi:hypothetical protein [Kibdelosporangium aridum]|uniref:hypothetical protein n=1 Tax=Kibdelosporangium aridum TaxID=2030 RepID=UPI0006906586|nr:hypothetical protein [Kibdelosporangium aridum]